MIQRNSVLRKKIEDIVKNILNKNGLFKKSDYNTKIKETEKNIPSVPGLVTTVVLETIEIEMKIRNTNDFITTPELNRLTKTNFDARMKKATKSLEIIIRVDAVLDEAFKST